MNQIAQPELIGRTPAIGDLRREIDQIAPSRTKVLITGESGVGKELVARSIHSSSQRASQAFVAVNCAGLVETLLESELFGHMKGSFTGAFRDQAGKLKMADRGTIFLDEVGEMPARMQGLLLRFLETGELQKVGADRVEAPVDVRVITATNRDLDAMVRTGTFREDLYYRLNVVHVRVPPLRERKEDIPALANHFLTHISNRHATVVRAISPAAMQLFVAYHWPGNVRELQNVLERLAVTGRRAQIEPEDLPPELTVQFMDARPSRDRRRTVADDLFKQLITEGQSFWTTVYPLYMQREITRGTLRDLVRKGLQESCGSYRIVARMFNMPDADYKRFLNFLRKHECQLPYREYRMHLEN
jgi:transcriptional regulator with PAS, ATPase and Fis domain